MAGGVSSHMFRCNKAIRISTFLLRGARTYLSEAYMCQDAWEKRLESPLIKKIKLDDMYHEIDQKYQQDKTISAVDVDLFATAVHDDAHLDELEDLVHRLRLSANAAHMFPSTQHSLVRTFLSQGHVDSLLRILNDRLNYGVFLDDYVANLLLDTFIKNKQYLEAAKVAVLQMLQENWDHPLTTQLCVLACVHHLQNPQPWDSIGQSPKPAEVAEEVKVRVKYLRNPYFDNHFDLEDGTLLVGKTLAMFGPHLKDKNLAYSIEILGLVLYGKITCASERLQSLKTQSGGILLKQAVTMAHEALKAKEIDEKMSEDQEIFKALLSSYQTSDDDLVSALEKGVKETVIQYEAKDTEKQKIIYTEWEKKREEELVKQLAELARLERLAEIEEKKKYLQEKEERLHFFDNEHEWELKIEENRPRFVKRWFGKKKKKRVVDEGYVPPEIGRVGNNA